MTQDRSRIKLTIAYQGTHYAGWQSQPGEPTVQDKIEEVLQKFHGQRVPLTASGRTDAGVHARGQVAHFDPPKQNMDPGAYLKGFNSLLPKDIRVTRVEGVSPEFHARFSARGRHYQYFLKDSQVILPWEEPYCWRVTNLPPLPQLNAMARVLEGEHDFSAFCAKKDPNENRSRRLFSSVFYNRGDLLVYRISGTAFLWRQVRSILGTIVQLALEGEGAGKLREILESRDRDRAAATAPAKGLFLERVDY
jgi:tRNA pseudouridine38-40 synthase